MNIYRYALALFLAVFLFSCSTGKHYFKKRIEHAYERTQSETRPGAAIETGEPESRPGAGVVMVLSEEKHSVQKRDMPAMRQEKTTAGDETQQKTTLHSTLPAISPQKKPVPVAVAKTSGRGNDKEGFILLLILAGLMVGLGLLFYFLIPAAGLVLLILFSILAGILLVLVLLALVF